MAGEAYLVENTKIGSWLEKEEAVEVAQMDSPFMKLGYDDRLTLD